MSGTRPRSERPTRLTREEARQQTRDRLLDAAAEVFDRLGYNGASLDAVAEAAGYTKGAVYSNFETKADLFIALLDRYIERVSTRQAIEFEDRTVAEFIDSLDTQLVQSQGDPEWVLLQVEFWLAAARDPEIREKYVRGSEEMRRAMGEAIDAKLAEDRVEAPFTGRELGDLLNALGAGLALNFYLEPEALDPKLFVRAARLLFGLDGGEVGANRRPARARRAARQAANPGRTAGRRSG